MPAYVFDRDGMRRVADTVRKVEKMEPRQAPGTGPRLGGTNVQIVLVTSLDHDEQGYYDGVILDRGTDGGWDTFGDCYVYDLNGGGLEVRHYLGRLIEEDDDGTPSFAVDGGASVAAGVVQVAGDSDPETPAQAPAGYSGTLQTMSAGGAWVAGERVDVIEVNDEELESGKKYVGVKVLSRDYGGETGFVDLYAVQRAIADEGPDGLDVTDDLVLNAAFAQTSCQFSQTKIRYRFEKGKLVERT